MRPDTILPRLVESRLMEALTDSPVVLIHGPRQCGKSTLARKVGSHSGHEYFTFDDDVTREAAETDPVGFVLDLPDRAVLDEVQRVPSVFTALKAAIDRDRRPGRFLLTGSANVLLVPRLADSLAGRMEILRLYPFAQCEIHGTETGFLDSLFGEGFRLHRGERLGHELAARIVAGGYPGALVRAAERRRSVWYRDYVETLVQRDVRELARIVSLDALPRLLALAAGQTARLLNVSDLAAPFQLSRPTIRDYVTLLERIFLIDELPPWHSNRLSRLVKSPKLHLGDTGVAAALLGLDRDSLADDRSTLGQLLETFVFQELRRLASGSTHDFRFHHFRDRDGGEVDIVLERGGRVAGVEVKAAATVTSSDFAGLRRLSEATGKRFVRGVVLHDGEIAAGFGDRLQAVPMGALWSG
ncbi:MAG: ATP-binding protein [Gemmatimonadota bacterium]|nr:ATP-binding protein [Gemmatimonadota bacterium]